MMYKFSRILNTSCLVNLTKACIGSIGVKIGKFGVK